MASKPEPCADRHPWWPGVRCELDVKHKGPHEAKLEDYSSAKIKWVDKEE